MLFICVEERIWWIIALLEGEYVAIIITMLVMGILLGFVGAGGAGFIIAILTLVFHIPIHVALATSLTAMAFTTLSGVISHYREGNVVLTIGGIVGDVERLVLISVQKLVHLYQDIFFIGLQLGCYFYLQFLCLLN